MFSGSYKVRLIMTELRHHLPFTLFGVSAALGVLGLIYWIFIQVGRFDQLSTFRNSFHLFHFSHIFLSAIATTAVFFRHQRNIANTVLVGLFGTLIPCGVSDILIPLVGGALLGAKMQVHLCLVEEPWGVFLSNAAGIGIGMVSEAKFGRISYFSHGSHVFVSSFASLFYLVTFGLSHWLHLILGIFFVTAFAVIIPCCSSDVIIPLSFVSGTHGHEHEDEHTKQVP